MEQSQRYIDDRQFGEVTNQYHESTLLGVPHIKVESDLGVYRCQTSQYNSNDSHSSSFGAEFSATTVGCDSSCNKDGLVQSNSASTYCSNRTMSLNAHHIDTSYDPQNGLPPAMRASTSTLSQITFPDRVSGHPRYSASEVTNGDYSPFSQVKSSRPNIVSPWSILPHPNERLQPYHPHSSKQQSYRTSEEQVEKPINTVKNTDNDDCESRQAFDLTCRARSPTKEEQSSNSIHLKLNEDTSPSNQALSSQSRCATKPQTCKICGKILSSPSSYYVHMKLHSGNKPYACTVCEASFCRKPYLEVHMRTHTGERPFECDMCYKRFTQKSSLNTHKRVHTGERPYSCDICHKTFAVKSYVTAHRWSHVSEKPLECQHCGLTFTSKNLFALHVRTHVDQNHECHVCGRTFMKDSYLIRHQNRVHRDLNSTYSENNESRSPSMSPPSNNSSCPSIASETSPSTLINSHGGANT